MAGDETFAPSEEAAVANPLGELMKEVWLNWELADQMLLVCGTLRESAAIARSEIVCGLLEGSVEPKKVRLPEVLERFADVLTEQAHKANDQAETMYQRSRECAVALGIVEPEGK